MASSPLSTARIPYGSGIRTKTSFLSVSGNFHSICNCRTIQFALTVFFFKVADAMWIVKGVASEGALNGVTKKPVFADNARGVRAALFEEKMKSAHHNAIN